jgi:hypothetical protein
VTVDKNLCSERNISMVIECACKRPECKAKIYIDDVDVMNVTTRRGDTQVIYLDKDNIKQLIEELQKSLNELEKKIS